MQTTSTSTTNIPKSEESLAIHGGKPALPVEMPGLERWGEPERRQLEEMLGQRSLFYWNGAQTKLLIERFRGHYPLPHVFPCSSGTAALHIAVAVAGIGPGDEVITSAITDMGTVIGILFQQGVPVFADLDPHTYNLDPEAVARAITPRTKAILAVHLAGNPCDLTALRELADQRGLILIEDCAQAWGAEHRGAPVGTVGDLSCFSLNDFKHIGCGDGGIVATREDRFGAVLQKFGDKAYDRVGQSRLPDVLAANYRISEPQSAVAAAQMNRMAEVTRARGLAGQYLNQRLEGAPGILPHHVDARDFCSFWFYMPRLDLAEISCTRDEWVAAAQAEGLAIRGGYIGVPLYRYPVFQNHNFFAGRWPVREMGLTQMDYREVRCPVTEEILESCIQLPIHQGLDREYLDGMVRALGKVAEHMAK